MGRERWRPEKGEGRRQCMGGLWMVRKPRGHAASFARPDSAKIRWLRRASVPSTGAEVFPPAKLKAEAEARAEAETPFFNVSAFKSSLNSKAPGLAAVSLCAAKGSALRCEDSSASGLGWTAYAYT